jgi:hypothetical protein
MSSLSAKDRVSLCTFTFSDGRRCRTPRTGKHPRFCFDHAHKEARTRAAQKLGKYLAPGSGHPHPPLRPRLPPPHRRQTLLESTLTHLPVTVDGSVDILDTAGAGRGRQGGAVGVF